MYIEELCSRFDGISVVFPGEAKWRMKEGLDGLKRPLRFCARFAAERPLALSRGCVVRRPIIARIRLPAVPGHRASDRSSAGVRLRRYGIWTGFGAKTLPTGRKTARAIILALIIDDGPARREHMQKHFDPGFITLAQRTGPHALHGSVCTIDFCRGYTDGLPRRSSDESFLAAGSKWLLVICIVGVYCSPFPHGQKPVDSSRKTAITPRREEDFPEWYQQVIRAADWLRLRRVRGCMVIRRGLRASGKICSGSWTRCSAATGHRNAYFPLLIPLSLFREGGGARPRLCKRMRSPSRTAASKGDADGKLKPSSALTEPLVIRPTSETIIGASYAKWVQSYRDLPILINPMGERYRWEMRTPVSCARANFSGRKGIRSRD